MYIRRYTHFPNVTLFIVSLTTQHHHRCRLSKKTIALLRESSVRESCSLVPFVPYKATRGGVGSQDLFHNNVTSEPPFVCIVIPCLGWTTYLVYVCGVCVCVV